MATVYLSSHTNSQLFTTCCRSAICQEEKCCPSCGGEVWPETYRARWDKAMKDFYGPEAVERMRAESRRKWRRYEQAVKADHANAVGEAVLALESGSLATQTEEPDK